MVSDNLARLVGFRWLCFGYCRYGRHISNAYNRGKSGVVYGQSYCCDGNLGGYLLENGRESEVAVGDEEK